MPRPPHRPIRSRWLHQMGTHHPTMAAERATSSLLDGLASMETMEAAALEAVAKVATAVAEMVASA